MQGRENENHVMNRKPWKMHYVRWIRFGNWLLIPIYVFVAAFPLYYEWRAEIPPFEQLTKTEGILTYKRVAKKGAMIGLRAQEGTHLFTCRFGLFGGRHDCENLTLQRIQPLEGKPATVWWFEQTVYPFTAQHRVAQVVVSDRMEVSIERTIELTERSKANAPWYAAGLFFFFVIVGIYSESVARRIERGQADS